MNKIMSVSERLANASNKVAKMPVQTQGYLYYPHVFGGIKTIILEADEQGNDSVNIEELIKVIEKHVK